MKELEDAVLELINNYEECQRFSVAVRSVGDAYEPGPEVNALTFVIISTFSIFLSIN